jgi:hypothetical protein
MPVAATQILLKRVNPPTAIIAGNDVVEPAAKSLAADTGASVARNVEEASHHPEVAAVFSSTSFGAPDRLFTLASAFAGHLFAILT